MYRTLNTFMETVRKIIKAYDSSVVIEETNSTNLKLSDKGREIEGKLLVKNK